ncbi:DVU0298 family protein [Desulfoscipio sp. XC116]|uniref:DVU0298 family protein n=1 Tax=Desulfoscipio sp. XC116 TaxID=3144975 RepID=UPI00325AFD6E
MNFSAIKKNVEQILLYGDLNQLINLGEQHTGRVTGALFSFLYSLNEYVRQRAIEGLGLLTDRIAQNNPERAKTIMRRIFWELNDESGGSLWVAPEAAGEIIYHQPELFQDYVSILASFLDDPALNPGVVRALKRISKVRPDLIKTEVPDLDLTGHI